ncbi:hypothetical protein D5018_12605 [Parashewanella curva]|uniref:Uncharacterized protein n=1 Tax=Parashewanella curva TaxID=2338552 RepID=A0A3L8PX12_9GAMM|nr:hypothetical protein [Parashewanella curva]RLV59329.1 hypothetical protein D5018_12605 [Parashewanella curva]
MSSAIETINLVANIERHHKEIVPESETAVLAETIRDYLISDQKENKYSEDKEEDGCVKVILNEISKDVAPMGEEIAN